MVRRGGEKKYVTLFISLIAYQFRFCIYIPVKTLPNPPSPMSPLTINMAIWAVLAVCIGYMGTLVRRNCDREQIHH